MCGNPVKNVNKIKKLVETDKDSNMIISSRQALEYF